MISHYFNSFILWFLFVDFLERRFPNEFRRILTDATINGLYLLSKTQIYFSRVNKNVKSYIETNSFLSSVKFGIEKIMEYTKEDICMYELIKNGESMTYSDGIKYDFVLYCWLSKDSKCLNKQIIYGMDEPISKSEVSDIRFILIEILTGEKCHKINLRTDNYNFYLVGNKFTKQFFVYYLKEYLSFHEPINENEKFILRIIDHDVNNITVDFNDKNESVILEKNGYKISITNHHDE